MRFYITLSLSLVAVVAACDDDIGGSTTGPSSSASSAAGPSGSGGDGAGSSAGGTGGTSVTTSTATTGTGGSSCAIVDGSMEANETEPNAFQLAGLDDCQDNTPLNVLGTIDGANDVDWFFYAQTTDETLCNIDPTRAISQSPGGMLRICKYIECQNMMPINITCPNNTMMDMSPAGRPGCCGTVGFDVGLPVLGCPTSNDLLNVYIKIDEPGAQADNCNQYNVNYHL